MEVSDQLHAPAALSPWKEPPFFTGQEMSDPRAGVNAVKKRNCLLLPGIEPRFIGLPFRSLVTILTELSRLQSGRMFMNWR
jgi:hypothetical protein